MSDVRLHSRGLLVPARRNAQQERSFAQWSSQFQQPRARTALCNRGEYEMVRVAAPAEESERQRTMSCRNASSSMIPYQLKTRLQTVRLVSRSQRIPWLKRRLNLL